ARPPPRVGGARARLAANRGPPRQELPVAVLAKAAGYVTGRFGGGLPVRAGVGGVLAGPGADRLSGMDIAPPLPVLLNQPGFVLPLGPVDGMPGYRPEGVRPGRRVLGGVLPETALPVSHGVGQ